jgi:hypothetical protein
VLWIYHYPNKLVIVLNYTTSYRTVFRILAQFHKFFIIEVILIRYFEFITGLLLGLSYMSLINNTYYSEIFEVHIIRVNYNGLIGPF